MARRSFRLMPVFCALALLAGCASGKQSVEQRAAEIQKRYAAASAISGICTLRADYGERVYDFTLSFVWNGEETAVEVLKPENIAGVRVTVGTDGSQLEVDGVSVETGPLGEENLTPLTAVPRMMKELREGYLAQSTEDTLGEQTCLRADFRDPEKGPGEGIEASLWLEEETGAVLQGELYADGRRILNCGFDSFQIEG